MGTPHHGPQSMYSSSLSLSNLGGTGRIEGGWEGGGGGGGGGSEPPTGSTRESYEQIFHNGFYVLVLNLT